MGAKIAGFVTCLMCAIPFFIIGHYKNSNEPIGLWTEDSRLRTKIHPVKQFNEEMSKVYLCCALVFCVTGLILLLHVMTGFVFLMLESTAGRFIFRKTYKKVVSKYIH